MTIAKAHIIDANTIKYVGIEYKGTDALGKLCRAIEEQTDTLELWRDNMRCLTVDVVKRAKKSLTESTKSGLRYTDYSPFPSERVNRGQA